MFLAGLDCKEISPHFKEVNTHHGILYDTPTEPRLSQVWSVWLSLMKFGVAIFSNKATLIKVCMYVCMSD